MWRLVLALLIAFQHSGCGDGWTRTTPTTPPATTPSATGPPALLVVTSTAGHNLDPDGYVLVVDGTEQGRIEINDSKTLQSVPAGTHSLDLIGIAETCRPHAGLPLTLTVAQSGTTRADLRVECLGIPDGVQIAFTRIRANPLSSHIAGMASDGSAVTELTSHAAFDTGASWSPDGSQLAFSRDGLIHVMNQEGTQLVRLVAGTAPAWSPDGNTIAFERRLGSPGCAGTIHLIDARGGAERQLTRGVEPTWSPDGTLIAVEECAGVEGASDIFSIDVDGGGTVNLTMSPDVDREPAWSPEGTRIAFRRLIGGAYSLWIMDASGAGQQRVPQTPSPPLAPAWTPDGKVLFGSDNGSLYVVNPDGTGLQTLTSGAGITDARPAWRTRP